MTYNVQKIREEVKRLKEETSIGLSEYENGIEQGRMEIINALSLFLDSMQEEPVSEGLEEMLEYVKYQLYLRLPEILDYSGVKVERKDFINDFIKAMMED